MATVMANIRKPSFDYRSKDRQTKNEIIFTCDIEAEHAHDLLFYTQSEKQMKHRKIVMSMIKKQKQFETQIKDFFSNDTESVLKIKVVYEKQQSLLNQIFFKIDEITKTQPKSKQKRVVVEIFIKRHQLKPSFPCVSYMYPYRQRFISVIPKQKQEINNSELDKIKKSKNYLEFYEACKGKLQNISLNCLYNAIKRIKPVFTCQNQILKDKLKDSWLELSRELDKNLFFQQFLMQMVHDYCKKKKFTKVQFDNYLKDNDIFTRSLSHHEAYSRYAQKMFEDVLTQIIIVINNQNLFFQFDRKKIIAFYGQVDKKFIQQYLQNELNLNKMLMEITNMRQFSYNGIAKKQPESNPVAVNIPTLFPFSYGQGKRYLKQVKEGANDDQGGQQSQNQSLFENKVKELFIISTSKTDQNMDAKIKSEINSLKSRFRQNSIFTIMKIDEQTFERVEVSSMLDELENKNSKLSNTIQYYLFDFIWMVYKGEQINYEIFRLVMDKIKSFSLAQIFIIVLADKETMKSLSKMLYSIKLKGYKFIIPDPEQELNPSIYLKYVVEVFKKNYIDDKSYLKYPKELFTSTFDFIQGFNDITFYLKLMRNQSYLQIQIPNIMTLLNKWIKKVQQIYTDKQAIERIVQEVIEQAKAKGIFSAIVSVSYSILSSQKTDRESDTVKGLESFIGTSIFYFWYNQQIMDYGCEDEEQSLQKVEQYFEKLKKFAEMSEIVSSSLNVTWQSILDIENYQFERGIQLIDDHFEDQTPRLTDNVKKIINKFLQNSQSNFNISLSNFAHFHFETIDNDQYKTQQQQKDHYYELWKTAYERIEATMPKKKFQNYLNDLSNIINFSLLKFLMKKYILYMKFQNICEFTNIVNRTLEADTVLSDHLGFYGLKLMRLNLLSRAQLIYWIKQGRSPWMKRKKFEFCLQENSRLRDPPIINVEGNFKDLIAKSIQLDFSVQTLKEIGNYVKHSYEIYWLLTNLMKEFLCQEKLTRLSESQRQHKTPQGISFRRSSHSQLYPIENFRRVFD